MLDRVSPVCYFTLSGISYGMMISLGSGGGGSRVGKGRVGKSKVGTRVSIPDRLIGQIIAW